MVTDKQNISVNVVDYPYDTSVPLLDNEQFFYIRDEKRHKGRGLAAILTQPPSVQYRTLAERVKNQSKYGFPSHKLVLLIHGHQSFKNALYQPLLADKLSQEGYYVLRIDFRGLGDSEDCWDPKLGRTIKQDVEDLTTIYEFVSSEACKLLLGRTLTLDTIVAHSRGVISMFEFAREVYVPNLINCCGRFDSHGLLLKAARRSPTWEADGGFYCHTLRFGEWQDVWIPKAETLSAGTLDSSKFKEIDSGTWVLSVYTATDPIIPITAAAGYSNLFAGRHTLNIVPNCDHNFYGLPDDPNKLNLSLRKGKVNYGVYLVKELVEYLKEENQLERFYKTHQLIKSAKNEGDVRNRWCLPYEFSQISNFRDVGGYTTGSGTQVRPGIMYRCANPNEATAGALDYMKSDLSVNKIFDLRATNEAIEGGIIPEFDVENLSFNNNMTLSPEEMAKHYQGMFLSSYNFPQAYEIVLENSLPTIRHIFEYVLDGNVDEKHAIVFHCTAGKDRTGILGMLILGIAGVDVDTISHDYELTTLGLCTEKRLIAKINGRGDKFYTILGPKGREIAAAYGVTPTEMAANVLSSKYEAMRLFIDSFLSKFGSFDRFFYEQLKFNKIEVEKIKFHLTI
ncbi:unnamed protein product [Kluyveromyces dobzhanskii CBS 2104]|uniref:WGS project CCBQ000000000 data, contig 00106 n=1 Tax=Kluyveromyces dobzhanskii CBS 2104 TaxID=1427455 RepID=A0A0A8L892_9SACH|nr:unnamed protein product [Kluyveromyces dobzhanskii CBS 2104]